MASVLVLALGALCSWWIWNIVFPGPVARGRAAYGRGDWNTAARLAQERLRIAKDDDEALRLMARASARLGRFSEAGGIYARLRTRDLEAEDHYLLGLTLARAGQFDAAQKAWRSALSADPEHQETLLQMAQLAFDRGQMVEGTQAAQRLAHQPGREVSGDLLLGMFGAVDHDPEAATEALRRALQRDPQARLVPSVPFSAQKLLARTLLQTGRSAEARELTQAVLAAGPDREASWLLSRAYLQEGAPRSPGRLWRRPRHTAPITRWSPNRLPTSARARCAECHRSIYQSLLASRHARTLLRGEELSSLPLPDHPLADPDEPQASHSYKWTKGRIQVETRVESRVFRAVVDYALGTPDRYTSLIGRDDRGQARTLRLSLYHNAKESGWDRTKNLRSPPAAGRRSSRRDFLHGRGSQRVLELSHHHRPLGPGGFRPRVTGQGDRLRAVSRTWRASSCRDQDQVSGPGHCQPRACCSLGNQSALRKVSRATFSGHAGLAERSGLGSVPELEPAVEPMLQRERRCAALRDLSRSASRRRDVLSPLRGKMPFLPCHVLDHRRAAPH